MSRIWLSLGKPHLAVLETDISQMLTDFIITLMMEAARPPETSVSFYQTTLRNILKTAIFMLIAVRT
jgi:hypothetical protein